MNVGKRKREGVVCLLLLIAAMACEPNAGNPEGAIRLFLRAVANNETQKVYELLTPDTQKTLDQLAQRATWQAGGARQFQPHEMIAAQLEQPKYRLTRVELLRVEGNQAAVKLHDDASKYSEVLRLIRVSGSWRVQLNWATEDKPPLT